MKFQSQRRRQRQQQVPEPEPELAPELVPELAAAPEPEPEGAPGAGARDLPPPRHFVHHRVVPPQLDEINPKKVVCGVIGRAEFNGSIPIVIGHEKQGEKREFLGLYLRFWCKSCDLTRLQSRYGLGSWTVGFRAWNNTQNNIEANNLGWGSRWGGRGGSYL